MISFDFVVRHLRWLAGLPLLPQIFDGFLLGWTFIFRRRRVTLMEKFEKRALEIPGVQTRSHRFGGIEFRIAGAAELGHLHGHGLLDVRLKKASARALLRMGRVRRHHVHPDSGWISFLLETEDDVTYALELLQCARCERMVPVVGLEPT